MKNFLRRYVDLQLGISALLLSLIGVVSIYSATFDARASEIFYRQMTWVAIGTGVILVLMFVPFRLLQTVSIPAYVVSLILLVFVLLLGKTVSGSTSWFNLGPFRIQPSEFAKITTVLALAAYLSRSDVSLLTPRGLAVAFGIVLAPVILIMMQPDFGTAVIYFGMLFALLASTAIVGILMNLYTNRKEY
jgi:rod shape determining protein RodA